MKYSYLASIRYIFQSICDYVSPKKLKCCIMFNSIQFCVNIEINVKENKMVFDTQMRVIHLHMTLMKK